ncbi:MAG TPA: hypothetical protein VEL82_04085 [Thermoplasmata archaeon]|nr:hypothetical protein [Thermoplasmata archaeon]
MVRILSDEDVRDLVDIPAIVGALERGYRADARGEVVPLPRRRTEAGGAMMALLGAALPGEDLLGFRSYQYRSDGFDRGHQIVALYRLSTLELRAVFLGRLVGNLRTGATIAAAIHLVEPRTQELGILGTGYQARNALACLAATLPLRRTLAWSPAPAHREELRDWAQRTLDLRVELAASAEELAERVPTIVLATSAEAPVLRAASLPGPRLFVSLSAYRRPELDDALLDAPREVWTDSVVQASGPGTRFEGAARRTRLRPLGAAVLDGSARDARDHRLIVNTGAAWEELICADALLARAADLGRGVDRALPSAPDRPTLF